MDFAALELLDQRFVETARVREKRKPRFWQDAPRIGENLEKVVPQQRLAACKENVLDTICRALVQNCLPPRRVNLGLCERGVFMPYAVAVRTAEVALRRQLQRHVSRIAHCLVSVTIGRNCRLAFLDRIYKIYKIDFKQVGQEIQEILGPPSAGSGVATPVSLLSLLFSMLKSCQSC